MPLGTNIKTKADFDMDRVFRTVALLRRLHDEMVMLYPGRAILFRQMELALLMRANMFIFGIYGSAKSHMIRTLTGQLGVGKDELFSIELSRFSTEADLYGPIDVPLMRDEGIQRRNTEGTMLVAKFADLGEVGDAPHLLRSLHGPLYEGHFLRGADNIELQLHSTFGSTNISPDELIKQIPHLNAFIDRWLFINRVDWLTEEDDMMRMVTNYRAGKKPTVELDHDDLIYVANLINGATDQIPEALLPHYVRLIKETREGMKGVDGWFPFSDRSINSFLEVLEANAITNGRYEVYPQDLKALRYVVCDGGSEEQLARFDEIVEPIVEELIEEFGAMQLDEALVIALDSIDRDMPDVPTGPIDDTQLVTELRTLTRMKGDVDTMIPELDFTKHRVAETQAEIDRRIEALEHLVRHGQPSQTVTP